MSDANANTIPSVRTVDSSLPVAATSILVKAVFLSRLHDAILSYASARVLLFRGALYLDNRRDVIDGQNLLHRRRAQYWTTEGVIDRNVALLADIILAIYQES